MKYLHQALLFAFIGAAVAATNPDLSVMVDVTPSRDWICHDESLPLRAKVTPDTPGSFQWTVDSGPVSISPTEGATTTATMNAGATTSTSASIKVTWIPSDGSAAKEKSKTINIKEYSRPGTNELVEYTQAYSRASSSSTGNHPNEEKDFGVKYPANQDDICKADWEIKYVSELNASAYATAGVPWYSSSHAAAACACEAKFNNVSHKAKAGVTSKRTWVQVLAVSYGGVEAPIMIPLSDSASSEDLPPDTNANYEDEGEHVKKSELKRTRKANTYAGGAKIVEEGAYGTFISQSIARPDSSSASTILKFKAGY